LRELAGTEVGRNEFAGTELAADMTGLPSTTTNDLSLHEMLRIMDVARTLRLDRELVDRELNRDQALARLREKLLATTEITGDHVTPAEVDAAIEMYLNNLHTFHDPPPGLQSVLAHAYVRRRKVLTAVALTVIVGTAGWWLLLSPSGPLSSTGRLNRALAAASAASNRHIVAIEALAPIGSDARALLETLRREREAALSTRDRRDLEDVQRRLAGLEGRLEEEYEVHIVTGDDRRSGIDRYFTDESGTRVSGYYLLVEAQTRDGRTLTRPVRSGETGVTREVRVWGERVPQAVYDRIRHDKQVDGILEETLVAVKRRGELEEEFVLRGESGGLLKRLGQITEW
jgi:hypothetical protein